MTMDEFRKDIEHVKEAQKMMRRPIWKVLMDVMTDEHPMNKVPELVYPEHSDSKKLGKIEGYNLYRNTLESAQYPILPQKQLGEATFPNPDPDPETEN